MIKTYYTSDKYIIQYIEDKEVYVYFEIEDSDVSIMSTKNVETAYDIDIELLEEEYTRLPYNIFVNNFHDDFYRKHYIKELKEL